MDGTAVAGTAVAQDAVAAGPVTRRLRALAWTVFLLDVLLLLSAGALWMTHRVPLRELTDAYLLGDAAIGGSFAVCGAVVTTQAPRNRLGWLMLTGGSLYLVAAGLGTIAFARIDAGDGGGLSRLLTVVFATVWMPAIAICLPLVLQLFPTGRPLGRFGPHLAFATLAAGVSATLAWAVSSDLLRGIALDNPRPLLPAGMVTAVAPVLGPVMAAAGLLVLASFAIPVLRLVRSRGEQRLQLLWLAWACAVFLAANIPGFIGRVPPPAPLLALPLVPAAMTVAILRYRLYGIRLIINRTVLYTVLTGVLLGVYLLATVGAGRVIRHGVAPQLVATGVVAVAFAPLRAWLQVAIDRLLFGDRTRPYTALVRLGRQLQTPMAPAEVLPAIASVVASALRLPHVRVTAGRDGALGRVVEHGQPDGVPLELPLTHRGEPVGTLTVTLPPNQATLDAGRAALLHDLARQAGPAVHAVVLTDELRRSRERTIAALEDERRRIRRDLHDGIGPILTGAALKAEAAATLLPPDQTQARHLIDDVARQNRSALEDVRRLVYGLRPPALDDLGLIEALRQHAETLALTTGTATPAITIEAPAPLPTLPAAVEVAAYRIATEALTNIVRHADARHATVTVHASDTLTVEVTDDSRSTPTTWQRGVGLSSMRERADELGGTLTYGPTPTGGRVTAALPLELP